MRRVLAVFSAALISCAANPPAEGTLRVTVDTSDSALTSRCVKVFARGSQTLETEGISTVGKTKIVVAIFQGDEPNPVEIEAIGYSDAACTAENQPAERTEKSAVAFGMPAELTLTLRRSTADAGVDNDRDGYPVTTDCNDNDPAIHPGATERCEGRVDDNCDTLVDCDDTTCNAQTCATGAICSSLRCAEQLCADGLDNDGTEGADCFDPDCDARPCMNSGTCMSGVCRAPTETNLCTDGLDNDGDTFIDCADSDCPTGTLCNDLNACSVNDQCSSNTCISEAKLCATTTQCFVSTGVCDPDGGLCRFTSTPDAGCNDGRACTDNDTCEFDGGCGGTLRTCTSPLNSCYQPVGMCSEALDGGCAYTPVLLGQGTCTDNDACTFGDTCDGVGGCRPGDRPTCAARTCQVPAPGCEPDAGCLYTTLNNGTPCDGGFCVAGTCSPTPPVFAYVPSNFAETNLPTSLGAFVVNCDDVTINTQLNADAGISLVQCDGGVTVPPHTIVSNGGYPAVLLFMDSLSVGPAGRLRGRGTRPLIFAVRGNVTVEGAIEVNSFENATTMARGAGANVNCSSGIGRNGRLGGTPETAGGGGGGAFGSNGGFGSTGSGGGATLGGDAGVSFGNTTLVPLFGGCNGGNGGHAGTTNLGRAGRGGGAVQISAGGTIRLEGNVSANGGGGEGGLTDTRTGGGGGGSGGAVLLECLGSLSSSLYGNVTANGGGGGEGSGFGGGFSGARGANGAIALTSAAGGATAACGGAGGNGAARNGGVTNGGPTTCGTDLPGGGGGGGLGRLRFNVYDGGCNFDSQSWFSPAPTGVGTNCQ